MKLLQIVDSLHYIVNNSFQSQLHETLKSSFEHSIISASDLIETQHVCDRYDIILSTLKLRTLARIRHTIRNAISARHVFVYEQDPWESFTDEASFPNSYEDIVSALNVKSFLNTSKWWSNYIISRGMPSKFVKMWVLPRLCSYGKQWQQREHNIVFQGAMHEHRKHSLEALKAAGVTVTVFPSSDYASYLQTLQNSKFFIHDESSKWHIKGKEIDRNALWTKEVEIASQGCFALRNNEEERSYCDGNPLVLTFDSMKDIPALVDSVHSINDTHKIDNIRMSGVDMIKKDTGWMSVVEALKQ